MPALNATLTEADLPGYVKKAFKGGKGKIVTVRAGMPLWKLTEYKLPKDDTGSVTAWWAGTDARRRT
jgi:hypothetical protein